MISPSIPQTPTGMQEEFAMFVRKIHLFLCQTPVFMKKYYIFPFWKADGLLPVCFLKKRLK